MSIAIRVRDALGREHVLAAPARRIVSLVPSLSEALFWLGVGERVVGVTDYCVHPEQALARVPRVGGTKNPDIRAVCALQPDLVIANREENTRRDVERLEAAGIRVFVGYARSVREAAAELDDLGALCGASQRAHELVGAVDEALARVAAPDPPVRVLALVWRDPYMAVGPDTFAADLLRSSGAALVYPRAERRYPRLTLDEIELLDPEVVLLPTEPYAFGAAEREELIAALANTSARDARVWVVPGELLTWYGPRMPRALAYFAELLSR